MGKEWGASFSLGVREGKNHLEPDALKIKLTRGAVSSVSGADTEQTALPEHPGGVWSPELPSALSTSSPISTRYQLARPLLRPQKLLHHP